MPPSKDAIRDAVRRLLDERMPATAAPPAAAAAATDDELVLLLPVVVVSMARSSSSLSRKWNRKSEGTAADAEAPLPVVTQPPFEASSSSCGFTQERLKEINRCLMQSLPGILIA